MNIKITKVMVLIRPNHPDTITATTDLPSATYPYEGNQFFSFNTEAGKGVEYAKKHFGVEPEVVDLNKQANQGRVSDVELVFS